MAPDPEEPLGDMPPAEFRRHGLELSDVFVIATGLCITVVPGLYPAKT